MKKILISLALLLVFTGCGEKEIVLDLEKVEIELNNLEITEDGETVKLFENNTKMSNEAIEGRQIDINLFEEILFSMDMTSNSANIYIITLPKEGHEENCEVEIDNYLDKYKENVEMYNPEEAKKIEERLEAIYGNYHIYIISKDNAKVLDKIKTTK